MPVSDFIQIGTKSVQIKRAAIAADVVGNNTIVAAVPGARIRVLALFLVNLTAGGTIVFEDGAGGADLTGVMGFGGNGQLLLTFNPGGWFQTSVATLLNAVTTGASNTLRGCLTYIETAD